MTAASSTWPPASARRMAVELIGSSTPSSRGNSSSGSTSKSCCSPSSRSRMTLPWRWLPKWKSSPTTMRCAPRQPTSTRATNDSRLLVGLRLVEPDEQGGIDAGGVEQLELLLEIGQQLGRRLGPDDLGRVPVEGDDHRLRSQLLGATPHLGDDGLVAEMHAVVRPDGDHRPAGGRPADGGDWDRSVITRTTSDDTGHGAAAPKRRRRVTRPSDRRRGMTTQAWPSSPTRSYTASRSPCWSHTAHGPSPSHAGSERPWLTMAATVGVTATSA